MRLSPGERLHRDEMFRQGMLWCAGCEQFHPVKDFQKYQPKTKPQTNYGYRFYCRWCCIKQRENRRNHQSEYFKDRNATRKAQFVELAGNCCQRCGYNQFSASLDFHHVYPTEKKYNPVYIIYTSSFEKAWQEIDKCCLLCRNCHSAYEAGLWRAEFIKRDELGWAVGDELPLDDKRYEVERAPKYKQAPLPLFTNNKAGEQLKLFEGLTSYVV